MPPIGAHLAIASLVLASPLNAQTIRGTVVDSATSSGVSAATVELLQPDSQPVGRERSNDRGEFRIRARGAGSYLLRVRRIGYRTLDEVVQISGDTAFDLRLAANPVELAPVGVVAERDPVLVRSGFYERREGGVGHFVDPAMVEKLAPKARLVADLLGHIPGVSIVTPPAGSDGGGGVRVPHLRTCRTISRRLRPGNAPTSMIPTPDTSDAPSFYPRVYLDGMATGSNPQHTFGLLEPAQILAMEVYMGAAQIPLQYGGTDAPCGVILIWTRR